MWGDVAWRGGSRWRRPGDSEGVMRTVPRNRSGGVPGVGPCRPAIQALPASGERRQRLHWMSVWWSCPYLYGIVVCMKKTFNVDDNLFGEAKAACGATTDT